MPATKASMSGREGGRVGDQALRRPLPARPSCARKPRPVLLDRGEALAHGVVPGHEQRSLGVALAQQLQAAFEFGDLALQRAGSSAWSADSTMR